MTFQRARSEEQREQRRTAILASAERMLAEMPVSKLSLNELSRRVGLAKSNVLRYFDSREAVLLELLDAQSAAWATAARDELVGAAGCRESDQAATVARILATSLGRRPVLCDLLHAEAGVLERNVSTESVRRHKHATLHMAGLLTEGMRATIPRFGEAQALEVIMATLLLGAASWPYAQPARALQAAYDADPSLAGMHREFVPLLARNLELIIGGLLGEGAPTAWSDSTESD